MMLIHKEATTIDNKLCNKHETPSVSKQLQDSLHAWELDFYLKGLHGSEGLDRQPWGKYAALCKVQLHAKQRNLPTQEILHR